MRRLYVIKPDSLTCQVSVPATLAASVCVCVCVLTFT